MSRNREFDESRVRRAIMQVFWERGYEATNLSQIEAATGLVRTSLYNAFGNKSEIFAQTLLQYGEMIGQLFEQMTSGKGADALLEVFSALMRQPQQDAAWPLGCLMVGAATQSATLEPRHVEIVRSYRADLTRRVRDLIQSDQATGGLSQDIDADSAAELLICVMWGALVSQCLDPKAEGVLEGLRTLDQILSGWKSAA